MAIDLQKERPVRGQHVGTFVYCSPELDRGRDVTTKQSDIWACGTAYYKMLTGQYPSKDANNPSVDYSMVPADAVCVIKKCLQWDPKDRPSAGDLLRDILIRQIGRKQ